VRGGRGVATLRASRTVNRRKNSKVYRGRAPGKESYRPKINLTFEFRKGTSRNAVYKRSLEAANTGKRVVKGGSKMLVRSDGIQKR